MFYNDLQLNNNLLTIPHPRINERSFVLKPLLDILTGSILDSKFININVKENLKKISGKDEINVNNDSLMNLNKILFLSKKGIILDFSKKKYSIISVNCTEKNVFDKGIYTTDFLKRENDHSRVLSNVFLKKIKNRYHKTIPT